MAGFRGLWEYVDKVESGKVHYSTWRKTPSQVTSARVWFDMSMSPGNPAPQYYAASPLVAQQMSYSSDGGIFHGTNVTPSSKHLKRFLIMASAATGAPYPFILADYLLYYPFVDTGTNDEQFMDNTLTLPRYTDGAGVQMMAVSVAANSGTSPTFTVNYTNQDGTSGRTSRPQVLNTATANGSIITSSVGSTISSGLFIGLQDNDTGVRSVQSVTFTSGTDVGLFALVLVKPLMTSMYVQQAAPVEVELISHQASLPVINDNAFLGILVNPGGSLSGVAFHGEIETVWN